MRFKIPSISLSSLLSSQNIATIYFVIMCIFFLPLEQTAISPIKVGLMSIAPLFFILKVPYISKALVWGMCYWGMCYFAALFAGDMRFSTLGFLGMYIISFIVFYNFIHSDCFSFSYFHKLLKYLIIAFGGVLIAQQIFLLIGLRHFPPINLVGQHFLSLTKLPSLTIEPSHSARILTTAMLGYLRCCEFTHNEKITIDKLFNKEHKWVSILFLWTMLTQGSGTGFIGLGILGLYFITRKTAFYIIPLLIVLFSIGIFLEIEQFKRPVNLIEATISSKGDIKQMRRSEDSGAQRILPLINTLTKTDLTKSETWLGNGTISLEEASNNWRKNDLKLGVIDQYGMIAFILSMVLVYSCMIKRILSLETLIFVGLLGCSLSNIYYIWGCVMIFTVIRYFQEQKEKGLLAYDKDE